MADIERHSTSTWTGTLREGNGKITTATGTLHDTPYAFTSRFENGAGTNPEELLAAAHSACFSMALAARLSRQQLNVHHIQTQAVVHLSPQQPSGFKITKIRLITHGKVEGIDAAKFASEAEETKKTCIVSEALSAVPTELEAHLD
jgi:osmotically inducible protein OsmC